MPRYFFHVENGERIPDDEGDDLPDDAAAILSAEQMARELSRSRKRGSPWRLIVVNEAGEQVAVVPVLWVAID